MFIFSFLILFLVFILIFCSLCSFLFSFSILCFVFFCFRLINHGQCWSRYVQTSANNLEPLSKHSASERHFTGIILEPFGEYKPVFLNLRVTFNKLIIKKSPNNFYAELTIYCLVTTLYRKKKDKIQKKY